MRGLLKCFVVMALAVSPLANASLDAEATNGAIAAALATSIKTNLFSLKKEVADLAYAMYQQGRPGEDVSDPYQSWVNNHIKFYCSSTMDAEKNPNSFNCQAAAGTAEDSKYLEMGDLKASVLLGPKVYSDTVDVAAQDFIRNMIYQAPSVEYAKLISSKDFISNSSGIKKYARFMVNQGMLSVALNSFNQMYFMRLSGTDLGVGNAANSSIMSVMENEATRRFTSQDWYNMINDAGFVQLDVEKERIAMEAFSMYMAFQTFKQNERIEALLAANLSKTVNASIYQDSMMPPR